MSKYYFVSDVHLGLDLDSKPAKYREQIFVDWLERVKQNIINDSAPVKGALFMLGDIFDFWFEYKRVVPKGFVRVFAKLAEMTALGIEVHFFIGNHDTWTFDYLEEELGLIVHRSELSVRLNNFNLVMSHGHSVNLSNAPLTYKLLHGIFNSKVAYSLFSTIVHPDLAMLFGSSWSVNSRNSKSIAHKFRGEDEFVVKYARECLKSNNVDYFVFGHLHTPVIYPVSDSSSVVVLGEWIDSPAYGVLTDKGFEIEYIK